MSVLRHSSISAQASRCWQVLSLRDVVPARQLAHQLSVSERQVRRLVAELRSAGVRVASETEHRRRTYRLLPGGHGVALSPVTLTESELLALRVAAQAANAFIGDTPLGPAAQVAFGKLFDAADRPIAEEPQVWFVSEIGQAPIDEEVLTAVMEGIGRQQSQRIAYERAGGDQSERVVDPLCILVRERAVVLVAWCHTRRDYRFFSLSRIYSCVPCDPSREDAFFVVPADFDPVTFLRPDEQGAFTEGKPERFSLIAEPHVAHLFREKTYRESQQIDEERADGRVLVSYEGRGFDEWRSFFQSWGTSVTVTEPPAMRRRLHDEACTLAKRYAE